MGTPRPISKADALAEAYKRGLLPPDKKAAYEEAQKRGLVGEQGSQPQLTPAGRGAMGSRNPQDQAAFAANIPQVKPQTTSPEAPGYFDPLAPTDPAERQRIFEKRQRDQGLVSYRDPQTGETYWRPDPAQQVAEEHAAYLEREAEKAMANIPQPSNPVLDGIRAADKGLMDIGGMLAHKVDPSGEGAKVAEQFGRGVGAMLEGPGNRFGNNLPGMVEGFAGDTARNPVSGMTAVTQVFEPTQYVARGANLLAESGAKAIQGDMEGAREAYMEATPEVLFGTLGVIPGAGPIVNAGYRSVGAIPRVARSAAEIEGAAARASAQGVPRLPAPEATQGTAQAQPSAAPVASPAVPQPPRGSAQPGTAGAGQQAAGPATLQATPTTVQSPQAASLASSDAKIIRRLLVAGGVARNDVDRLLGDMVHQFNLSNDPRSRLAFFAEEYLPTKLDKPVADDVIQKLRGFGRERYGANSPRDPSRSIMRTNIGELRGSQREFLTDEFESLLGKETLMNKQGKITRDKQGVAEAVYREEIGRQQRLLADGKASPEQMAARDDLLLLMGREDFFKQVPPELHLKAADEGKSLWEFVHQNPLEAAHWMQSELGVLARKGNSIAQTMRMPLVRRLEDAVPGYRGARLEYGDLSGQQAALEFGDDLYRVAASKFDTDNKALEFKKLSPAQRTVAKKSIRDKLLNEFRKAKTGDDQAAVITAMQKDGVLDALETVLGPDGKKVADAIRGMVKENDRIRAVDLLSGSNTADNLAQQQAAREAVRSPVNKAIGAIGDEGSYLQTGFADLVSVALGLPPVWTAGKVGTGLVGKLGSPSKKKLASATQTLYGKAPRNALNIEAPGPGPAKPRAPGKPRVPKPPVTQETLDGLLAQYDKTPTPAIRNKIIAARKALGQQPANALNPASKPPAKKPPPGTTSQSPAALTSAVVAGTGAYVASDGDPLATAAAAAGGGILGNRLAKAGSGPKAPPKVRAPVGGNGADAAAPATPKPSATVSSVPQSRTVAKVTTADGRGYEVTADVIKDRDAVVMSPAWPSNIAEDLTNAIVHQRSRNRARASGMDLANDPPRSPDWAEQNPQEWASVQKQVGERFLGMARSTPGDAHILALVDGVDVNSLGSFLEANLPAGKRLLISPANGEIAIVSKGANLPQFETWTNLSPRYNQSIGLRPAPAEWAGVAPPPPKPKAPSVVKNVAGRAAVGAGLATMLAGDAKGQEDLTGKISETEQSIAAINKALADFDKLDARGKQKFLKDAGFYAGKIDGNIAGMTTEGIERWTAKQESAIGEAEAKLTDLVRRSAYQRNQPDPFMTALRDVGPSAAGLLALLGLKFMRGSAAKSSVRQAAVKSNELNRFITKVPSKGLTSLITKSDTSRPANLNTLWQKGGASKDQLPFKQDSNGNWKPNPNAKPADELFADNGYWRAITKYVSGTDLGIILASGVDVGAAQIGIDHATKKLQEAEAEWKANPSDEAFQRVEDAQNELALYNLIQRVGAGVGIGRVIGAFGKPYAKPRPDIPMAATEQAAIKQLIASRKSPPKPRNKLLPPPPPALPPPGRGGSN